MVTEIDLDAIKTRIVDVLKGTTAKPTSIFNLVKTKDKTTFRTIAVGAPNMNEIKSLNPPAIVITNDDTIEDDVLITNIDTTDTAKGSDHTINLLLIFIDKRKDGQTTEKQLDDFGKSIKQILKANYQLKTVDASTDPKVDRIWPRQTAILNRELTGGRFQGRVIRLRITKRTS